MSGITTNSLKIHWMFDNTTSVCIYWMVKYTDRGKGVTREIASNNPDERDMVFDNLYSGATYTINMFGVTMSDVLGDRSAEVDATISKYNCAGW